MMSAIQCVYPNNHMICIALDLRKSQVTWHYHLMIPGRDFREVKYHFFLFSVLICMEKLKQRLPRKPNQQREADLIGQILDTGMGSQCYGLID
jgi:hypothetical protein